MSKQEYDAARESAAMACHRDLQRMMKADPFPIRLMTVDECVKELETAYDKEIDSFGGKQYCSPSAAKAMALALSKLGTIKVVGDV